MKTSLILAVLLSSSLAWGQATVNENLETAYIYVDANSGSDSNPGTMSQPLKTISRGASLAMGNNYNSIGSRVIINPGTYRESVSVDQSGRSTSLPITFEAATSGTVFVSGADVWTGWMPYSGNPSIYTQSWPFQWGLCSMPSDAPPVQDIVLRQEMIIVNGTPLTEVLALTSMQPGTFFPDEANATVYAWPPTGTNMSTATVEVATRPQLLNVQSQSYVVLRGLTFQYANSCGQGGAVGISHASNILIDNDSFLWNNATGLGLFYDENFTVQSSLASHNGKMGMGGNEGKYGLWQSDTSSYNNWRGAQGAFYTWDNGNKFGLAHNSSFNSLRMLFNQGPGVWFDTDAAGDVLTGLISVGNMISGLFVEKGEGPVTVSNSYLCGNNPQGWAGYGGVGLRNSTFVSLTETTLFGNGANQIFIDGVAGGQIVTNWETGQVYNLQTGNLTLSHNLLTGDSTTQVFGDGSLGGEDWDVFASTLSSDHNTWWAGSNTDAFTVPGPPPALLDLSGWQSLTGQDINSSWTSSTSPAACNVQSQGPDYWLMTNLILPPVTVSPAGVATYTLTTVSLAS